MADLVMIALRRNLEIAKSMGELGRARRLQSRIDAREVGEVLPVPAVTKPKVQRRRAKAPKPAQPAPKRARKPAKTAQKEAPAAEKETPAEDTPSTVEKEEAEG